MSSAIQRDRTSSTTCVLVDSLVKSGGHILVHLVERITMTA